MKRIITILIFTFFVSQTFGQQSKLALGPWNLSYYSGEYKFEGLYRTQEQWTNSFYEEKESKLFNHTFSLNTKSFIWHPNFMIFDADFQFSPGTNNIDYLVTPNFSEVRTANKVDLRAMFFQNKPISLGLFANFSETYQNRENLTNIKTNSKQWGANFHSKKFLPFTLSYNEGKWDQTELASGRLTRTDFTTFEGRMNKSFTKKDKNEFVYTYNNMIREDVNIYYLNNWYNRMTLSNNIYFDNSQKYNFSSRLGYYDQKGDMIYKRLDALERLNFKLPYNLRFMGSYRYYNTELITQKTVLNGISADLNHQLYKSLNSSIYGDFNTTNNTTYLEHNNIIGLNLKYTKKIPYGVLNINYNYFLQHIDMNSDSRILNLQNERYIIDDNEILLLRNPYVETNTIVVKDETGTIIYIRDLDYIVIENSNFIEIRRVPGGQIINQQTILVDYIATQPGDYSHDSNNSIFGISVLLFKDFLNLYYRRTTKDYFNIVQTDFVTLNYLTRNVYGGAIKWRPIKVGVEYDDYNSTITPYYLWKYFMEFQIRFKKNFLVSLNAYKRDYYMIEPDILHIYNDINLRFTYSMKYNSKIMLQAGYRQQIGPGIDLDLFISRIEYSTMYRKVRLSAGVEIYKRDYLNDILNFSGGFIRLSRRFN